MLLKGKATLSSMIPIVALPLFIAEPLAAQDTGTLRFRDRVPATIALVDEIDDAPEGALILRRIDRHPYDVVVIARQGSTPELLSAAVFTLLAARNVLGDVPDEGGRIRVLLTTGPRAWDKRVTPRLGRLLEKLQTTDPSPVAGIGIVPNVTVWLPADYELGLDPAKVPTRPIRNR